MKTFRLHYFIENNGDGSASTIFCKDEDEADSKDKNQGENWSEESSNYVELRIKDGKIFFSNLGKWIEVKT